MNRVFIPKPGGGGIWTETSEEMKDVLVKKLKNNDIVMIKGSFSMSMDTIVSKLKTLTNNPGCFPFD